MTDAFIGYATWCKAKALRSMAVAEFVDVTLRILNCLQSSSMSIDGERYYLMDVRLAGIDTKKRLGSMARKKKG